MALVFLITTQHNNGFMVWLAWFFSPVGVMILPAVVSLGWYFLPKWRNALTPRVRAWITLSLLASSSLAFFWWLTSPLEVLLRGNAHMLEWFLRMEIAQMTTQDALEYRLLIFPLVVQVVFTIYGLLFTIFEQMLTFYKLSQIPKTPETDLYILETEKPLAFTYGWWKPQIFISRAVWQSELSQAVLAHETMHQKRFDPLRLGLARFLYRMALLNPFATWLWQQYQLEIERLCDQQAATRVGKKHYATALVSYAELRQGYLPAVSSFSAPTLLEHRVQSLIQPTQVSKPMVVASSVLAVVLLLVAVWQRQGNVSLENPAAFVKYFKPVMRLGMQNTFLGEEERMVVLTIYPNSLADQAGFRPGDEILTMCGKKPVEIFFTPWRKCDYRVKRPGVRQELKLFFDRSESMKGIK